ncbi:TolC family protein [Myxococcus stipitatus]|uniref:TolC family protein n=1 Tax=Myxococcus stipitatus TaxID=83455 RepID=UPI001F437799|nr:TolC family protein [Myxococcus stipitatus]MCE9671805.1 TolC family protein [Myxococcus stipitatus]
MNALLLALLLSRAGPVAGAPPAPSGSGPAVRQRTASATRAAAPPQQAVAQGTPAQEETPGGAAPRGGPPTGGASQADTEGPPVPEVSDPMLTPVPPAPLQVKSWDEALGMLRQRSTDLRTALAQVEAAAGQARIALAALLPTITGTVAVQLNVLDPDNTNLFFGGGGVGGGIGGGVGGGDTGGGDGNVGGGGLEHGRLGAFQDGSTPVEEIPESPAVHPTKPPGAGILSASVPLLNFPAIAGLRTAREAQRTASWSLAETRRQLSGALAQALVRVAAQERLAEVNRVNLRTALERLALAQRRLDLGAGTRLDVVRVQQDAESARALVVTGDESLRQARESLGLALGLAQAVGLERGVKVDQMLQRARKDCRPIQDLETRADLRVARSRVLVAERQVKEVKAQYLPSLFLSSSTVALTVKDDWVNVPLWNIGASLVLPFWDGGVREGALRQTRAQAEVARQQSVELERTATIQVIQARRGVEVARTSRDISSRERQLAEENDRLTRRSFEVGTGTSLELIQTAAALRQAELALVVREFQLEQALVEAFLAEAACDW